MQLPDGKTQIAEAKKDLWVPFNQQFPNADKNKFESQVTVESKGNVSTEIFFKASDDFLQSMFGSDRKYWSSGMKKALGLEDRGGFPYQLSPLGSKVSLPIPAVPFEGKVPSLKKIFNAGIKIYVTPDQYFTTKCREIFQETKLRHTSGSESKLWLGGPDMKYWPQQLNFAVFCATQGCGILREIFDSGIDLPQQIRAFYRFHMYFTVRRVLYQLEGIQSVSALPGDPPFSQFNNNYDVASYKRLCTEVGIDPSSDFRFTHGANHRLNLPVAPQAWLMPARMMINTESTVGYNNKLKQAVSGMKLRVNNRVNPDTKKVGLTLMEGGPSKINPPNSHPSNATAE